MLPFNHKVIFRNKMKRAFLVRKLSEIQSPFRLYHSWLPKFHNVTHCLACSDDAVTVWTLKRRMCACRGETSGCKINHASSESKQGGEKEKENQVNLSKAEAFEIHLGCGRAGGGCLFVFRSRDTESGCIAIGVSKSVYD